MTAADVFLLDVLERPDEAGRRLVHADWLEDQGEPALADLVRLEARARRLQAFGEERYRLGVRMARLERRWAAKLPRRTGLRWCFRHGAITLVADSADAFAR